MIKIESKKNKFTYNVYHVTKAFYPKEDIVQTVDEKQEPLVKIHLPEGTCFSLAPEECVQTEDVQEEKRNVTKKVYQFLSKQTGQELAWGMLTGVRPTKLVMQKIEQEMTKEEIFEFLKEQYCVGDKKAQIAYEIACREKALLDQLDCKNGYSLYAGIPFCPSICSYCSFSSSPIVEWKDQVDRYLDAMIKELKATAKLMQGKTLDTVYIGGGTPTTLEPHHLKAIFDRLKANFDFSKIKEFTLEAGRPDTITKDKLYEAKQGGVNRISINPQTMNEQTLKRVGRKHTPDMVRKCFEMARKMGFDNINMDLIAGLPEETVDMFKYSLDEVIKLDPENITVHSMCVKRAASLRFSDAELAKANDMNEMLSYTQKHMEKTGRKPYYMYRQKNISGNLENVGYAKDGCMSTYNINIMEEKQTIIALGGGGSTKIVMDDRIERVFNFKDPLEYIRRFDEILKKKDEILDILAGEKNG